MKKLAAGLAAAALVTTGVIAAAPAATAKGAPTIVDRAIAVNQATGLFDTVIAAAVCTPGIVPALQAKGQKTLFAPTDAAFAELGLNENNVCSALDDATRFNILAYHVTEGRRGADWLASRVGTSITMLNGDQAAITTTDRGLGLAVDGAAVIVADVAASNGFIHAVDKVLLP